MSAQKASVERFVRELPASRVPLPPCASGRAKYALWRALAPLHPLVRAAAERAGVRKRFVKRRSGRQDFLLGYVAPGQTLREFVEHCAARGYGNHFAAWRDEGQVASLRLVENFVYQYHLRVFVDGEVRGHYEFTPECYPLRHLRAVGQEDKRDAFYEHLGERIRQAH